MRNIRLSNSVFYKLSLGILLAGIIFSGCDTVSESGNRGEVTLQFQAVVPPSANGNTSATLFKQAGDTLRIEGSNGTLLINDIRFIVDDFALERADGECESTGNVKEDDCEEFEADLLFVDLPLNGEPLKLNTSPIKKGLYAELEFEIDDLETDDEEASAEQQRKQAFLEKVREEFPKWPGSASMVIGGAFINNQGKSFPFFTFAQAEVDLEMDFDSPLEVKDNTVNKLLTVKINPENWFKRLDGSVINLRSYDYPSTKEILEFEAEMEEGFVTVEIEED